MIAKLVVLSSFLGFASFAGNFDAACFQAEADQEALSLIAKRHGVQRLSYEPKNASWRLLDKGIMTNLLRPFKASNRYEIVEPLETLIDHIKPQQCRSQHAYHLTQQAYASLSTLYSYYKINPDSDSKKHLEFIGRLGVILQQFKRAVDTMGGNLPLWQRSLQLPPLSQLGNPVATGDKMVGLHYLDMAPNELRQLNHDLAAMGNPTTRIDRLLEFYPVEKVTSFKSQRSQTAAHKMVLVLVHGTFASRSSAFLDDGHILFQQAKYMAQTLANDQNVPVSLVSFGWNGANDNEARMQAGEELANLIRLYFPPEEYLDIYVGHSHGGNVILHTAKTFREYRTPYMVVTLAAPIRKDFMTDNLNYLFQFYSESDWVQYAGAFEMTRRNSSTTGRHAQDHRFLLRQDIEKLGLFAHNDRFNRVKIYGVRLQINSKDLQGPIQSHLDMKYILGGLPKVLDNLMQREANKFYQLNVLRKKDETLTVDHMERLEFDIDKPTGPPMVHPAQMRSMDCHENCPKF